MAEDIGAMIGGHHGQRLRGKKIEDLMPAEVAKNIIIAIGNKIKPETIAEKINSLLTATRPTKHGDAIDTRAVEVGLKLYLSYMVGLPVQRIEQINVNVDADNEKGLEERILSSPALQNALRRILAKVDGQAGG